MKKAITIILLLFGLLTVSAQTATDITNLQTPTLDETSALFFITIRQLLIMIVVMLLIYMNLIRVRVL
jgi:hypothetical protein